jgi:hypothetical protein
MYPTTPPRQGDAQARNADFPNRYRLVGQLLRHAVTGHFLPDQRTENVRTQVIAAADFHDSHPENQHDIQPPLGQSVIGNHW